MKTAKESDTPSLRDIRRFESENTYVDQTFGDGIQRAAKIPDQILCQQQQNFDDIDRKESYSLLGE